MALQDTREGRDIARLTAGLDDRVALVRKAMEAEAVLPLPARLAAWLEAEGIASGDAARDLAERLAVAAGEDQASAWLGDGTGSQALRDAAGGIADLASLGDAGLAAEDYWHGHGRRP